MEDFYNDGDNAGRDRIYLNGGHEHPQSESDWTSYERGREYGEHRQRISDELDREVYGEER